MGIPNIWGVRGFKAEGEGDSMERRGCLMKKGELRIWGLRPQGFRGLKSEWFRGGGVG